MFYDAHQHLHDSRLAPFLPALLTELPKLGIAGGIVNGTSGSDWQAVEQLCAENPWLLPAFGLHPWYVKDRSPNWEQTLTKFLDRNPGASIGEAGLDCWIEGHDIEDQKSVFIRQLAIAREGNVVITIHCVKAHEPLRQVLQKHPAPARGFLLHAWGGPADLTSFLLDRGAHFSFPPYFLHERKAPRRALFQSLPADRILVETDAPDLLPPPGHNPHPLTNPETGQPVNHPANLLTAYESLAALRDIPLTTLSTTIASNWNRLFAPQP
ncbi:MAG TPA: TatD family hydrolase [Verrucomicrobiales bacterium]|nr:TatD family hydrolase [Verrucomicrobiales bacterium]